MEPGNLLYGPTLFVETLIFLKNCLTASIALLNIRATSTRQGFEAMRPLRLVA